MHRDIPEYLIFQAKRERACSLIFLCMSCFSCLKHLLAFWRCRQFFANGFFECIWKYVVILLIYHSTSVSLYAYCKLCNFNACIFKGNIQYYDNALMQITKLCWQNKGYDGFLPTQDAAAAEGQVFDYDLRQKPKDFPLTTSPTAFKILWQFNIQTVKEPVAGRNNLTESGP